MKFVCDAPFSASGGRTWFQIETQHEAEAESALMNHAVAKYWTREYENARARYKGPPGIEHDINLKDFIRRTMPTFLTLRESDGGGLATAMISPEDENGVARAIVVGPSNADPYPRHGDAIEALGKHLGLSLPRERCFPYARTEEE
jgi:hypothetical protein